MNETKKLEAGSIKAITLPTKEEYEAAMDIVPRLDGWWWLRSPGCYSSLPRSSSSTAMSATTVTL